MPTVTNLVDETLTYPNLEKLLYLVSSPAIAIRITQISYRPGYLPNPEADRLTISQIVTVANEPLVADSQEIWIAEGLQLVTFPVNDTYTLRLNFPAWYQQISVKISAIEGLSFAPGSSGMTSQAGLNAVIAQINAALATKAAGADVAAALALKANLSDLDNFISTTELIQALTLKADADHNHEALYYSRAEVDALIVSTGPEPEINTTGLVAWYDCKPESGTNLAEKSGSGRNGTLSGSVSWVTSSYKRGLLFNGGFVDLSRAGDAWITTGELTWEIVFLPQNPDAWSRIFEINGGPRNNSNNQITLVSNVGGSGIPGVELALVGGSGVVSPSFQIANNPNKFRSLSLTASTSGIVEIFDGLQSIARINNGGTVPNVTRAFAYLGRSIFDANANARMILADFRIYNRCLSDDERIQNFRANQAALLADGIII